MWGGTWIKPPHLNWGGCILLLSASARNFQLWGDSARCWKVSPSSSGGGNAGSHPPEPIGTTSPAPRTRASKVNELGRKGDERSRRRRDRAEDAALAPHSVPQLQPPSVSGSTSSTSNFQWSHHLPARRCFDSTPTSATVAHPPPPNPSPSSLARSIPYTVPFPPYPPPPPPPTQDEQADGRTDASRTRCAGLPDTGRQQRDWWCCWPRCCSGRSPHRVSPPTISWSSCAATRRTRRTNLQLSTAFRVPERWGDARIFLIHNFNKCDY